MVAVGAGLVVPVGVPAGVADARGVVRLAADSGKPGLAQRRGRDVLPGEERRRGRDQKDGSDSLHGQIPCIFDAPSFPRDPDRRRAPFAGVRTSRDSFAR